MQKYLETKRASSLKRNDSSKNVVMKQEKSHLEGFSHLLSCQFFVETDSKTKNQQTKLRNEGRVQQPEL